MFSNTLSGMVALVTGAGGGIGSAVCAALMSEGATVVASDIGASQERPAAEAWYTHDVTSAGDWARLIADIGSRFGRLDALINNAGIALVERLADTSLEQWRRVFSVNVESILLGLQASLPLLRDSGKSRAGGSSVVNLSSTAGLRGVPLSAAYSASKGAVTLLTKSAAREFAGFRYPVRVNSVHPGVVDTPMIDSIVNRYVETGYVGSAEEARTDFTGRIPLHRLARPEDIAGGVVFLCSPASSFMTGAELVIDGGAVC